MPATYDSLATVTLGSAATSINFNSISASFTDLKLILSGSVVAGGNDICMRLNNDGTAYGTCYLIGNGSTPSNANNNSDSNFRISINGFLSSAQPFLCEVDIMNYRFASGKKPILGKTAQDQNGNGNIQTYVGTCFFDAAVSSIQLFMSSSQFTAGTTASLYGILRA